MAALKLDKSLIPESTANYEFDNFAMSGVSYVNALQMEGRSSPRKVEINAGRSRKRFLGVLGIPDGDLSATVHQVEISLDDAPPVFVATIKFGETKDIDLDVTNVLRIRITVTSKAYDYGTHIGIGNGRLT